MILCYLKQISLAYGFWRTKYREQTPKPAGFKKRKKGVKKIGLSFGDDEDESEQGQGNEEAQEQVTGVLNFHY